jgi:PDZ domain-containing protein
MTEPTSPEEGPLTRPERPRAWWPFAVVSLVLISIIVAVTVQLPYYAIAPGGALDVGRLVRVSDGNTTYEANGSVLMCTVSLKRTTVVEALQGWLDPSIDVVKDEVIVPPTIDEDRLRKLNLQAMDTSKEQALAVAFEHLGYDSVTGSGAQIVDVVADSPAEGKVEPGETITAIDGAAIELHTDAIRILRTHRPGDRVRLTVVPVGDGKTPDGATRDVDLTLQANPEDRKRAMVGVTLRTRSPGFDFPFEVTIDSEGIGGPSAGLAFTLELLEVLTPGELTGGKKIAATGTMELDGSVGEVGGVAQKAVAVRRAGAELFLVPHAELAEARAHAGKGLRVEPVRDLEDALRILEGLGGNGLALERPGRDGA